MSYGSKMPNHIDLSCLLEDLPNRVIFAFCYGSGVFKQQEDSDPRRNMIDFVFAVDDVYSWHTENIRLNPKHYSMLRFGGAAAITVCQLGLGAHVYYNPFVQWRGLLIKYGVLGVDALMRDLMDWDRIYISGRLHKPVRILKLGGSMIEPAIHCNHYSAVRVALLQLPETFSEMELFTKICELSYRGDYRMVIGEHKQKVQRIVSSQVEAFRKLYEPILLSSKFLTYQRGQLRQDFSRNARLEHLYTLPEGIATRLRKRLDPNWGRSAENSESECFLELSADSKRCASMVASEMARTVLRSSIGQTVLGVASAGLLRSVRYAGTKLIKAAR